MAILNGSKQGTFRASVRRALHSRLTVLRDNTGSMSEAIAATGLSIVIIGIIAAGSVADIQALTISSSNAERLQHVNALVDKPGLIPEWADATATAHLEPILLPSGASLDGYLWAKQTVTGTEFTAATPRSGYVGASNVCGSIAAPDPKKCLYATAFKATNVRAALPVPVDVLKVSDLTNPFPRTAVIARAPSPARPAPLTATTRWRYYIKVSSIGLPGTVLIMQGANQLAKIPVGTSAGNYFGTVPVAPGQDITVYSSDRTVAVTKFLLYKTGK